MHASLDTTDLQVASYGFRTAIKDGATNVKLCSIEDPETKKFQCVNLSFDSEHYIGNVLEFFNGQYKFAPESPKLDSEKKY